MSINNDNQTDSVNDGQKKLFNSRRLEKLSRGSFKYRQNIERNRQQIKAYKESKVALNIEGRRAAAEEEKVEKDFNSTIGTLSSPQSEPTYHRPLPPTEQRPPLASPQNRFIKPTDIGRAG